jgi:hypothetical protein
MAELESLQTELIDYTENSGERLMERPTCRSTSKSTSDRVRPRLKRKRRLANVQQDVFAKIAFPDVRE